MEGQWRDNEFYHGTVKYNNGHVYKGFWKNGRATLITPEYVYDGFWKNGLKDGFGI